MEPQKEIFPPKQRKGYLTVILTTIIIVLIGGLVALGIMYKDAKSQAADAAKSSETSTDDKTSSTGTVAIKSIGYPYEMPNDNINTTLVLPDYLGGVNKRSTIPSPGVTTVYTSKFNDEMGRWLIGYLNEDAPGSISEISLVEISESWLSTTNENPQPETPVTPAEKSKFLADLKAETAECVKDASTGFTTKDKTIDICYTVGTGVDGYSPRIAFEGYSELKERPFYLTGAIWLHDGLEKDYNNRWQEISTQIIADFKEKKYPAETKTQIDNLISALSQTEITVTDRVR